jgi:spore maturation protein CgeB
MSISDKIKRIMIYIWGSNSEQPLINALSRDTGLIMTAFSHDMKDYHADAGFSQAFLDSLHQIKPDAVFSYDYFPLIAMICSLNKIPYISWIYDCPQYTLNSLTINEPYNFIFCFDRIYAETIRSFGAAHVFHQPLGVDVDGWQKLLSAGQPSYGHCCLSDISDGVSFIGSFYDDCVKNRIRSASFDDQTRGYIDGLIRSQSDIWGSSFIYDALDDTAAVDICNACGLSLNSELYSYSNRRLAADAINMELTRHDRTGSVARISEKHPVHVWTSALPQELCRKPDVFFHGYADYMSQLPYIFRDSAVNLNFTSRSIESGIPLRVLDILACGGFCLTYYQPEIASDFENGRDLVMAESQDEMPVLADYYLTHPDERSCIAKNGFKRVHDLFSLTAQFKNILHTVDENM